MFIPNMVSFIMSFSLNNWLVYLGLFLIILELVLGVSTGFDLLLSGLALLAGGVVLWLTNIFWLAIAISIVLILIYFILFRTALKDKMMSTATKNVNIDKLIKADAIVVKSITPARPGQVKVDGEIWRAESDQNLEEGDRVVVNSIEGVTLKVVKKEAEK